MQVGDAFVRVDHCQVRAVFQTGSDIGFDCFAFVFRQFLNLCQQITKSVVDVGSAFIQSRAVLFKDLTEVRSHSVTKNDRVGHLHHGGLHVQREQNSLLLCFGDLFFKERQQRAAAHEG